MKTNNKVIAEHYEPETGTTFYQIDKRTAEKMFNGGYCVYLLPYKIRFGAMWIQPAPIRRNACGDITKDWNKTLNQFIYYNCSSYAGRYPKYYVNKESYIGYNLARAIVAGNNTLTTK